MGVNIRFIYLSFDPIWSNVRKADTMSFKSIKKIRSIEAMGHEIWSKEVLPPNMNDFYPRKIRNPTPSRNINIV